MLVEMTEAELSSVVRGMVRDAGMLSYHTYNSRRSDRGWPDLVIADRVGRRFLVLELKTEKGRLSEEQEVWLAALQDCGVAAAVLRPSGLGWFARWVRGDVVECGS